MPTVMMLCALLGADLSFPADYRDWVFLSSGLGMTYGATPTSNPAPHFTNVFVDPPAWRAFKESGRWPDGATFILEIRDSASEGSINKGGHYQTAISVIEASRKLDGKWQYFDFGKPDFGKPAGSTAAVAPLPEDARCYACHRSNGAVEWTFVQFYPAALEIAKRKGTLRPEETAQAGGTGKLLPSERTHSQHHAVAR